MNDWDMEKQMIEKDRGFIDGGTDFIGGDNGYIYEEHGG